MALPRPAARWLSRRQHELIYECGSDTERIRYLGVLRLDPLGEVGGLGAEVARRHMRAHDLGPLAIQVLEAWARVDRRDGALPPKCDAPMHDHVLADMTTARPGASAPPITTDSGRLVSRATLVLRESTPANWRWFMQLIDEVSPYLGSLTVAALLTTLDEKGVIAHNEEQGDGVRPALRLACHMAAPTDLGTRRGRRMDPKVAGRAGFYSAHLADALVQRVGLTQAELAREDP